jgi:AmmeMemoRadiSam system protein B
MQCRKPIVAGQFYPDEKDECLSEINSCIKEGKFTGQLPQTICGGIVPHAGWFFSGSTAALVFSAIKKQNTRVDTFIIFGAAHSYLSAKPVVYDKGCWETPMGEILIDEQLCVAVLKTGLAVADNSIHRPEHSLEVQVPFIQYLFPNAKILPVITPPATDAIKLGEAIADIIGSIKDKSIVCIGSTDLTHYGPGYGFTPAGTGPKAFDWADNVNDKQFIDLAVTLEAEKLLSNAAENSNACGPGAAAATIAAAKKLGRKKGLLLSHTNSLKIMLSKMGRDSSESVGYAAIVF